MKLQRFDRPFQGAWWSKVFPQPASGEVPERPLEVTTGVQPVFDFLGSSKHVGKSIYAVSGAGGAFPGTANPAIPSTVLAAYLGQALPVPADEIWICEKFSFWHDDAAAQWGAPVAIFPDLNGWHFLGAKQGLASGVPYVYDTRWVLPPGWTIGLLCNGPLGGGKKYYFSYDYVPLKVGETLAP